MKNNGRGNNSLRQPKADINILKKFPDKNKFEVDLSLGFIHCRHCGRVLKFQPNPVTEEVDKTMSIHNRSLIDAFKANHQHSRPRKEKE